jgi:hypothetical protein
MFPAISLVLAGYLSKSVAVKVEKEWLWKIIW